MNRYRRKGSKSGIYLIHCNPTKKVYVGQTISLDGRKLAHLAELRRGVHRNVYLQRTFIKYGEEAFVWEFIECDVEHLNEMEQYFIDNIEKDLLMNMLMDVKKTPAGIRRSEETKRKTSLSKRGIPNPLTSGDLNGAKRPEVRKKISEANRKLTDIQCIDVYTMHRNKSSQQDIADKYGVSRSAIRTAIRYGYQIYAQETLAQQN